MKKIRLTVTQVVDIDVMIDDRVIDADFIRGWEESMFDLHQEPESIPYDMREDYAQDDYAYFNLAEAIAYSVVVNQDDHLEGLKFRSEATRGMNPIADMGCAVFYDIKYEQVDYEAELDYCEL